MPTISSIIKQDGYIPDDAKMADHLVYDYILFGEDGIDCNDAELSHDQCKAVTTALADGVIVPYEKELLSQENLSKIFIETLSGPIGSRALWGRLKWFHVQACADGKIIGPLIEALDDEEPAIREKAALSLSKMGPKAKDAVEKLIDLLDDEYAFVRQAAVAALGKIGPDALEAKDALIDRFENDESVMVSHEAALALCCIAPDDGDVVSAFAEGLKSEKSYTRRTAALSLGKIGPHAKDAVPELTDALGDKNSSVR